MKKINLNDPKLEGIKEFLRMILISILPVLISSLESGVQLKAVVVAVVISALRAIDKYLYVSKSENIVTEVLKLENIK